MGRGRFLSAAEILSGLEFAGESRPGHRLAGRRRVHGLQAAVRQRQNPTGQINPVASIHLRS